jgi:signal transduction histidine kinase
MSFRARFLLAAVPLALLPLFGFALLVRSELGGRMEAQVRARAEETAAFIREDLARRGATVGARLDALAQDATDDNLLRAQIAADARVPRPAGAAGAGDPAGESDARAQDPASVQDRSYLLGWAGQARASAGLDLLQLQDGDGRILSSGHFRNAYDRIDRATLAALRDETDGPVLVRARTATGALLGLARARRVSLGSRDLWLVGGVAVDRAFVESLARAPELAVSLDWPGGSLRAGAAEGSTGAMPASRSTRGSEPAAGATPGATPGATQSAAQSAADAIVAEEVALPFVDAVDGRSGTARFRIAYTNAPVAALRARLDRWLVVATVATALAALLLASWLASRVTQPLADLARTASRVDLERLDARFPARRTDEIGTLAGVLNAMTARLRDGAARLREAERRAAVGEIARQVNHDIKNGLVPIRNVVRHLGEVARDEPAALAGVLVERQSTLDSGIAYLESLAANYARLSPRGERRACDVNAVVRDVVAHASTDGTRLHARLEDRLPHVHADPVALRRIVENLVVNALESLPRDRGAVTVSTGLAQSNGADAFASGAADGRIVLEVADTGSGMTQEQIRRAFEDFYTTKERGTGLGLSIVRRLVADMGGSLRVESEPGAGTRFRIELGGSDGAGVAR